MDRSPLWPWNVGAEHRTSGTTGDGAKQPAASLPPAIPWAPTKGPSVCASGLLAHSRNRSLCPASRGPARGEPGGAGARESGRGSSGWWDQRPHLFPAHSSFEPWIPHAAPSQRAGSRVACSPRASQGLTIETALQVCLRAESPQDKGPEGHREPSRRGL